MTVHHIGLDDAERAALALTHDGSLDATLTHQLHLGLAGIITAADLDATICTLILHHAIKDQKGSLSDTSADPSNTASRCVRKPCSLDRLLETSKNGEFRAEGGRGRVTVWGYARVSTPDQDPTPQCEALARAGVSAEHLVTEHASGARQDRPGLTQLLDQMESGDVLVVWKLDRLGRSLSHLVRLIEGLGERGIEFRSLTEALDTTTPSGRLIFHVIGAVAEFERDLTRERTAAALAAARAKGRPSRVTRQQWHLIHRMSAAGATQGTIAATTGLSRAVVGRVIRGEIASLARFNDEPDDAGLPLY